MESNQHSDEEIAEHSVPVDQQLADVLDFAVEGARGGSFLVIKTDEASENRENLLRSEGYEVLSFDTVGEADLAYLMRLFEVAQSYGLKKDRIPGDLPQGKVALIFSSKAWTELAQHKQVFNAYQGNNGYMVSLGFAERPKNLE